MEAVNVSEDGHTYTFGLEAGHGLSGMEIRP